MLTASVAAILTLAVATPAFAQAAPSVPATTTADDNTGLGDIVVTAQRRDERLQDVPISITALSAADLDRAHINSAGRLQFVTPGFSWGQQGSDSFPAIRGVRTSLVSAQNDPVIGFFLDGIYQSRTQQQSIPLFDVARVEVQRGPQGTLYGRNTFGGNISVVTQQPGKDLAFGVNADVGNYSAVRVDGFVNLPISETLAIRLSGVYMRHDGYVHSVTTPGVTLNDDDENAQRLAIKWTPTSALEVVVHAGHWQRDDAGAGSYGYKVAGTLINPATGYQSINGVPYAVNPSVHNGTAIVNGVDIGVPVATGPYENNWDYQPFEHLLENYASGTISYDFGPAVLRSITGYTFFRAHRSADNDQSSVIFQNPAAGFGSGVQEPNTSSAAFTQEFQIASTATAPLQWIVGAFYLHDRVNESYQQKITAPGTITPGFKASALLRTDAYAGYAQATYAIVPELKVTAGIRYSHEKKAFEFADYANGVPGTYDFGAPYSQTSGAPTFNSTTWRAGLQYTPDRSLMLYATASTGFESGGVNDTGGSAVIPSSYAPQKVNAYEVGAKARMFDGKVQADFSLFYNKFRNLQINVYTPLVSYFGSAGKARSKGGEIAIRTLLATDFHVDLTAAYLDAKYTTYISRNNFFGASNGQDPVSVDLAGKRIPNSPKLTTTAAVYYELHVGDEAVVTPYVSWMHSSGYYTTDYNTALDRQKNYNLVDVALRYAPNSKLFVEAYGNNVFDKPVLFSGVVGRTQRVQVSYGPPATYGLRAGVKF
ncbi:TonB-dependent receptor [Sphingomonas sp.]|uniref:TonB-dependent receptor n=1 Tax=Sphingomonas sp. TaxID=28214 RepID=UPI0025E9348E|nr:TonB-dependent receptor [Sphingomonas sp.]